MLILCSLEAKRSANLTRIHTVFLHRRDERLLASLPRKIVELERSGDRDKIVKYYVPNLEFQNNEANRGENIIPFEGENEKRNAFFIWLFHC